MTGPRSRRNFLTPPATSDAFGPSVTAESPVPKEFRLGQNYPKPFNQTTVLSYDVNRASELHISAKPGGAMGSKNGNFVTAIERAFATINKRASERDDFKLWDDEAGFHLDEE